MFQPVRVLLFLFIALLATAPLQAQQSVPVSERDKVGYMIGLDAGRSIAPAMQDIDIAAFQRALENAMAGGKPLLEPAMAQNTSRALMANIVARANGNAVAAINRADVGLLVGNDVGGALQDVRAEFDMPMFLLGVADAADPNAKRALGDDELRRVRASLSARIAQARQAAREELASAASRQEETFLAQNKQVKGVFTTPSGLQYMVLRQGDGPRPRPGQRVRVHYQGTLLDGTVFDSSYARNQPAEFRLDQVIAGWTEGVGMMPVGGKYRFWIPARLGYGEKGMGGDIPPNATLTFDVELLGVE